MEDHLSRLDASIVEGAMRAVQPGSHDGAFFCHMQFVALMQHPSCVETAALLNCKSESGCDFSVR
ncbi:hypothetical protein CNQ84_06305 [Pseudomonas abyssi]|uniref:Uncharacterized protein n=2 Tax=Pseudomonas abyssi TaxID=170540 RepID=A0ACD6B3V6_9PSED|nr:hypothetical protein [Pseudomonadales bacterium]MAG67821.1 hypothetical protein [Pseudomonadales bacterium]PBK05059.1 hypothetical protein CNQ84_06305 [Pseudomonas abyssi]RGP55152.1 hypothetical protein ASB58_08725 [Halopseudomonas gallaeciensis]